MVLASYVSNDTAYKICTITKISVMGHYFLVKPKLGVRTPSGYLSKMLEASRNKTAYAFYKNNKLVGFIYLVPYKNSSRLTSNCLYMFGTTPAYSSFFLSWVLTRHEYVNYYPIEENYKSIKSLIPLKGLIAFITGRSRKVGLVCKPNNNFKRLAKYLEMEEV